MEVERLKNLLCMQERPAKKSGASAVRVFGYLFLPDTVEAFEESNPDVLSAIYVNGYSALKELESYMSIPASQGRSENFIPETV